MPQKQKSKSWQELKQAGNECFKTGQYGEATSLYSQAIKELEKLSKFLIHDLLTLHQQRTVRLMNEDAAMAVCTNSSTQVSSHHL